MLEQTISSQRAAALTAQFDEANSAVIAAVENASAGEWRHVCPAEGWTFGVVARHIAVAYLGILGIVKAIVHGDEIPDLSGLDDYNALHAREHADCTPAEVLALLKSNGGTVADYIRSLSDEQLDRATPMALAGGADVSAAQMIEEALIGHAREHLQSLRDARPA